MKSSWPKMPHGSAVDATAVACVRTALELRRTHPQAPALDTLDLAMQPLRGGDPDFADRAAPGGDWTDEASPFGQLLAAAFPGQADPVAAFGDRYALWGATAGGWAERCFARLRELTPDLDIADEDLRECALWMRDEAPHYGRHAPDAAAEMFRRDR